MQEKHRGFLEGVAWDVERFGTLGKVNWEEGDEAAKRKSRSATRVRAECQKPDSLGHVVEVDITARDVVIQTVGDVVRYLLLIARLVENTKSYRP